MYKLYCVMCNVYCDCVALMSNADVIKGPLLVTVRLEGYFMGRFPVHGGNRNA